jgi:teichoic acid transport system permease protein
MRYAVMESQRTNAPGAEPYNALRCATFYKHLTLYHLQAYCHPLATVSELWLAAAGWAVVALGIGIIYFWRAEARFGRG